MQINSSPPAIAARARGPSSVPRPTPQYAGNPLVDRVHRAGAALEQRREDHQLEHHVERRIAELVSMKSDGRVSAPIQGRRRSCR
jgi:hypothetical protein